MERNLDLLKAFADRTRLRLMHLLAHRGPEVCVCDFMDVLQIPQSTVSRQIAPLRMLGLVKSRRAGTWVYYALAEPVDKFHQCLIACLNCCAGGDKQLSEDLERYDELIRKRKLACCYKGASAGEVAAKKK
jgi:ArsR family transcriptional regulator